MGGGLAGLLSGGAEGMMDPRMAALLGIAGGMMQAGGPSRTPVSFGQALNAGLGQGLSAYAGQRMLNQQAEDFDRRRRIYEDGLPPSADPAPPPVAPTATDLLGGGQALGGQTAAPVSALGQAAGWSSQGVGGSPGLYADQFTAAFGANTLPQQLGSVPRMKSRALGLDGPMIPTGLWY